MLPEVSIFYRSVLPYLSALPSTKQVGWMTSPMPPTPPIRCASLYHVIVGGVGVVPKRQPQQEQHQQRQLTSHQPTNQSKPSPYQRQ